MNLSDIEIRVSSSLFALLALRLHEVEQVERQCYNGLESALFHFPETYVSPKVRRLLELYNLARAKELAAIPVNVTAYTTLQAVTSQARALLAAAGQVTDPALAVELLNKAETLKGHAAELVNVLEEMSTDATNL